MNRLAGSGVDVQHSRPVLHIGLAPAHQPVELRDLQAPTPNRSPAAECPVPPLPLTACRRFLLALRPLLSHPPAHASTYMCSQASIRRPCSAGLAPKRKLAEFRVSPEAVLPVGYELRASHFVAGQYVDVTGTSIGKGFQGVMKKWGFSGQPASHGNSLAHRAAGSTGACQVWCRVWAGLRPGGQGCAALSWHCDRNKNGGQSVVPALLAAQAGSCSCGGVGLPSAAAACGCRTSGTVPTACAACRPGSSCGRRACLRPDPRLLLAALLPQTLQDPGKVFKGKKMPGRMGGERATVQNCQVFRVDPVRNLLYVRGQVPGHKGNFVLVRDSVKKGVAQQPPLPVPTLLGGAAEVTVAPRSEVDPFDYREG